MKEAILTALAIFGVIGGMYAAIVIKGESEDDDQ